MSVVMRRLNAAPRSRGELRTYLLGKEFESKEIDWEGALSRLRPRFKDCDNDLDHVKNVMLLLAVLQDGHTYVIRSPVDRDQLPGQSDGLFGGGLAGVQG